ncbi:MAG: phosphoribosyl-AMP cyclohydrolase [Clostridia bacterium]|nr:phosphoribosyl-AMP cyclohydrolase [Clostridia bacterium]
MIDLNELWKDGKIMPVITVESSTGRVLLHGYMNKTAFAYTLKTGKVWYLDPKSGEVKKWGEHAGNVQKLISIKADDELESLLIKVEQVGHVCHKGTERHKTCFINDIYTRHKGSVSKHRKFGKVEVDENFDYSKEDYEEEFEN